MVIGKSGVGKSTLINKVFRKNLATAGVGAPVTKSIRKYTLEGVPLQIYDTPGLELSEAQQEQVKADVSHYIRTGAVSQDINQCIHCIWFCIAAVGTRIEENEKAWLRELSADSSTVNIPVVVVLTKASSKEITESFKSQIEAMNLPIQAVVPVLADYWKINDTQAIKPFGLKTLIAITANCLPEDLHQTLQNVQIVSVELKSEEARKTVRRTVLEAAGIGATPLPDGISDALLLVPLQIKMIAQITAVFGFTLDKAIMTSVLSATVGAGGATVLGKTVVASLLKLIPGAGQIVGGLISGATAGILTSALGEAYIRLMEALCRGDIKQNDLATEKGMQEIRNLFEAELRKG